MVAPEDVGACPPYTNTGYLSTPKLQQFSTDPTGVDSSGLLGAFYRVTPTLAETL